ncbi:TetR/AcrR family transcriptional regulator [uncultured Leifsonia sp.]|uniref:TetR/AcrR family transcriptional regulator n=1 Tax=uncultured Leifsonia sp. TaxID=340359 RepID=UPI0028D0A743|nr:TetR/AcrR family transcriptional regulator [uncultured Leifsonia sp.]
MAVDSSPMRRPGGRNRDVTERLLAAALEILADKGVDGLQYEELASRAQVGRATVYRRWPKRDDLVREVLGRFAELSVPIDDTGEIVRDLTAFLLAFAEAAASASGRAMLQLLLGRADDSDEVHRLGRELLDRRTDDLQRRLDRATEAGQLPPTDAPFVNMMLAGPVQWFVLRRARPFTRDDAHEIVELVVTGLWRQGAD